jgi:hypothetical protein
LGIGALGYIWVTKSVSFNATLCNGMIPYITINMALDIKNTYS